MKDFVTHISIRGRRPYQEDREVHFRIEKSGLRGWLLAVMDGHVGESVAELCAKEIPNLFRIDNADKSEESLHALISELHARTAHYEHGSTISLALVLESHDRVSVAVLGDSPVVVIDKKGTIHKSPEHNVRSNLTERESAEKRGGIYDRGYIWNDLGDLGRGLQMSRALGDSYLGKILSHEPEIYTLENPKWVLVASDGVFDPSHNDNEHLLEEIRNLGKQNCDAKHVLQWAEEWQAGLSDNATALVWRLLKKY